MGVKISWRAERQRVPSASYFTPLLPETGWEWTRLADTVTDTQVDIRFSAPLRVWTAGKSERILASAARQM